MLLILPIYFCKKGLTLFFVTGVYIVNYFTYYPFLNAPLDITENKAGCHEVLMVALTPVSPEHFPILFCRV